MPDQFYHLVVSGYCLDVLDLLRILLALLAIYYYSIFGRRLDAAVYQHKTRQMTFLFFAIAALSDFLLHAFGTMTPVLLLAREVGQLGVAFTIFAVSRKMVAQVSFPLVLVMPSVLTGIVHVADMDLDILSLVSIALVLLAVRNYRIYNIVEKPGTAEARTRMLFTLALLTSYVFQFLAALFSTTDLILIVDLSELMAIALGVYAVRWAVKSEVF